MNSNKPIEILLVEDNPADVDLVSENLALSKILNKLYSVQDGLEALDFLHKEGAYATVPTPDLILLDLNLPRMSGREFLEIVKEDPMFKRIPVVVLTSSEAENDILRAYDLHAAAYVTKPVNLAGFTKIVQGIESFWFSVVKFPPAVE